MKKLIQKILSVLYRPIINLLKDQNTMVLQLKGDNNDFLNRIERLNSHLVYMELMKNDFVYSVYHKKRDLSKRILIKFWVPDYKHDTIQRCVVDDQCFFSEDSLVYYDQFIKDDAIILDIGGNIGNHSLYWALVRNAKKIIAFEPYTVTADHFIKNTVLNKLENVITVNKLGLGEKDQKVKGIAVHGEMGASSVNLEEEGDIEVRALDNIDLSLSHIDLIKIDVEEMEDKVLLGAIETIKKYKPTLIIEHSCTLPRVHEILKPLDYVEVGYTIYDRVFRHKDKIKQ